MGGVRVDADTQTPPCPACSPPARSPAACTARTGWEATRSPTCWSSAGGPACTRPSTPSRLAGTAEVDDEQVEETARRALAPFEGTGGENPYAIHADLQEMMQDAGRDHPDGGRAATRRSRSCRRLQGAAARVTVDGQPPVQPRLAPGPRPAVHARHLRGRDPCARSSARRAAAATRARTFPTPTPMRQGQRVVRRRPDGAIESAGAADPGDARRAQSAPRGAEVSGS